MLSHDAIADHLRHLEALGRSPDTIANARRSLVRWDRQLPMGILVALPEEIEELLAEQRTPGARATYYDTIVRWFRWLARTQRIDYDPTEGMQRPKVPRRVPRPANDRHVRIACTALDPWRLHARLAAYAGLRCIEISRLDRDDIAEHDGILLRGKGGHERIVPCPPEVWDLVQLLPSGPVAGGRSAAWVSDATNDYLQGALHLRGCTMHRFRAWYATTALAAGADLRTVQELLGHKSVSTTEVYTYVFDQAKRDAVARMPRLAGLSGR